MVEEKLSVTQVKEWLREVVDPEIPVISLIDLGVLQSVEIDSHQKVTVKMTPTFVGCPATATMKEDIEACLLEHDVENFEVILSMEKPWSSNQITETGKKKLKEFGLAPPQKVDGLLDLDVLEKTACPFCNSEDTELKNPFGPTLCRAIHYCHNCQQAFEQFKPVG